MGPPRRQGLVVRSSAQRRCRHGKRASPAKLAPVSDLGRREKPRHSTAKGKRSLRVKRSDPSHGANARPKAEAVPLPKVPTRKTDCRRVSTLSGAAFSAENVRTGQRGLTQQTSAGNGRSGPAMRPRPSHAAKSSVGELAARESESAQCKYPGWKCPAAIRGGSYRQIRKVITLRKVGKRVFGQVNWLILHCQEKPLARDHRIRTAIRHR
jgi:hypothetical protein